MILSLTQSSKLCSYFLILKCIYSNTFWFFNAYIPMICRGEKKKGRKKKGPFFYKVWVYACSVASICDPLDCSMPGSSVHRILQARILEGVAISSFRGYSQPRDRTQVSCIAGRFFTTEPPGKPSIRCGSHKSNRPESRERERDAVVESRDDGKLVGGVTSVICALELFRKLYPISTLGNEVGNDGP